VTAPDQREGAPRREGHSWRLYVLIAAVIVLAIFVLLNSQKVEVDFLVGQTETPLIVALLLAGALGALIGWAWPHVRRSRKYERELARREND
jgi:uncharacterized integral membrane protein